MCFRVLLLVVVTVCGGVSASASRWSKIDERTFKSQQRTQVNKLEPHFIYPRTGRLFHADYVRDNEIFRSLERTNFMRRGPFARSLSLARPKREDNNKKKHVYLGTGRLPGVGTKKGSFSLEKDVPPKAVLLKVSESPKHTKIVNRAKRDIINEKDMIPKNGTVSKINESSEKEIDKQNVVDSNLENSVNTDLRKVADGKEEIKEIDKPENEVEEDSFPHVKNNDTDKTLFVHDLSKTVEEIQTTNDDESAVLDKLESGTMKKMVVDDSLNLYPVYRGVKYHYPWNERHLVYSPQLTVQMDLPVISDYIATEENNSTKTEIEEGRSRRTLKKLALPLLLALKLKTAILLPLILGLISLISFKGLWSGLTALGIAAALGLKALVAGSGPKVVVQNPLPPPPPHIHHFGPHEYAEYWNRRGDDFNDYRPTNSWT